MAIKIRGIVYDQLSKQDDTKINGDTFSSNSPFMIICNKSIPKNYKTYMEFTITEHPNNTAYRHIPLYVGLHKEPSFGVLNSDFIIGTIYYTLSNMNYDIMERYNASGNPTHQEVEKTYAKIPILNTVIGIGADIQNNTINIYSDGDLFYSFSPSTFNLSEQTEDFYFVIYSKFNERIKGSVNYGRYKTKFIPDGYWDLYQYYYTHSEIYQEISCSINIPGIIYNDYSFKEINSKINSLNDIAPLENDNKKHIKFIYTSENNKYNSNTSFKFTYHPGTIPEIRDIVTTNFPIPIDKKIYLELNIKECELNQNFTGVPIEIGITENINELNNAFGVNLYHEIYKRYKMHSYINGEITEYDIRTIENPVTPMQPDTLGVLIELDNNKITVYTDNSVFFSTEFKNIKFNSINGLYYFYIRAAESEVYKNTYYGVCNFGEEIIDFDIPENSITLFYYYNNPIKFPIDSVFINCRLNAKSYKTNYNKFIYCNFYVSENDENINKFSPGLNELWGSYNIITDTEEKNNVPDTNIFDLDDIIKEDELINDRRIWIYYYLISRIFVKEGDPIPFNSIILDSNTIIDNIKYYRNILEGNIKNIQSNSFNKMILDSNLYIINSHYIKQLSGIVSIGDYINWSDNRDGYGQITGTVVTGDYISWSDNRDGYGQITGNIDTLDTINYNNIILQGTTNISGYEKWEGTSNGYGQILCNLYMKDYINWSDNRDGYGQITGTVVTGDYISWSDNRDGYGQITGNIDTLESSKYIKSLDSTLFVKIVYTVTIIQSDHQTITVHCNGNNYTNTFTADSGSTYTVSIVADDEYEAGTLSTTGGTVTENITISATAATLKKYTITVTQPANGKITVNGTVGTSFTFDSGTSITVQATANSGYKVTALYVDKVTNTLSANIEEEN